MILPVSILEIAPRGCINIHASLLPRWRGAAPIHRAIEAGDAETGVTIMQMEQGLDTGPMMSMQRFPILPEDTTASLHDKLAQLGGEMIVATLKRMEDDPASGKGAATPQPEIGITYAAKISKEEALLDFTQPAVVLERKIRAFNPFPGACASVGGTTIKFWRACVMDESILPPGCLPGQFVEQDNQLHVVCGEGALTLLELQKPGGKRLATSEFLKGFDFNKVA